MITVLCPYPMAGVAENLRLSKGDATGQLSSLLPSLIAKLTHNGAVRGGLGNAGDLTGMLGAPSQTR